MNNLKISELARTGICTGNDIWNDESEQQQKEFIRYLESTLEDLQSVVEEGSKQQQIDFESDFGMESNIENRTEIYIGRILCVEWITEDTDNRTVPVNMWERWTNYLHVQMAWGGPGDGFYIGFKNGDFGKHVGHTLYYFEYWGGRVWVSIPEKYNEYISAIFEYMGDIE